MLTVLVMLHCGRQPGQTSHAPDTLSQEAIRGRILANFNALRSLKGQANLTVETPEQSFTATARIWFHRPDSLFIIVEAAFGIDVGRLYAAGDRFILYLPRQNLCYTGSTEHLPLSEFISYDMSYDELLRMLFGEEYPAITSQYQSASSGKAWRLTGMTDSLTCSFLYDNKTGLILEAEGRDQHGAVLWQKKYSRFKKKNKVTVAQSIRFQEPEEKRAIALFYNSVSINETVVIKNQKLRIPANAQRIELED